MSDHKNGKHGGCGNKKDGVCSCGCKVSADRVRQRAYEIYLARKGAPGDAAADWLQAERELRDGPKRPVPPVQSEGRVSVRVR